MAKHLLKGGPKKQNKGKSGFVRTGNDSPQRVKTMLKGYRSPKQKGSIVSPALTDEEESRGHINSK